MAPCNETEARDKIKVPPEVARAFTDKMLEHMIGGKPYDPSMIFDSEDRSTGTPGGSPVTAGKSYPEALQAMHEETGLQKETINQILKRDPKVFSISKQAIAKAGHVRMIRNAAEAFGEDLKHNGGLTEEPGALAKAWDAQRRLALTGHSTIFDWSHKRNFAVQLPTKAGIQRMQNFWASAGHPFKYAGEAGKARYEMDMSLMQMDDHYDLFKQSSLDVVPGKRMPGDILLQQTKPKWSGRNFDALKVGRYKDMSDIYAATDPSLKVGDLGKAYTSMTCFDLNCATGSVMKPAGARPNVLYKTAAQLSDAAGHYGLLMSSKLFFAKHMDSWLIPLRYTAKLGRMSVEENAAKNVALGRWSNTVTAHLGILGVNYAFNKMMGWETPNLTNPGDGSTFLRIKLGNWVIPFSPMLEALRLPIVFTAAMAGYGGSNSDTAGLKMWRAVWNAAHPSFHTLYEQVSGKDFMGRPIPWASARGLLGQEFPALAVKSKLPPVTVDEYLLTRFSPIAPSGGIHEFYQALRDQGVDHNMSEAFVKGAAASAASALVGIHGYEQEPKKPKRTVRMEK